MRTLFGLLVVSSLFLQVYSQIPGPPSLKRAIDELQEASRDPAALRSAVRAAWLSQHASHIFEASLEKHDAHLKGHSEVNSYPVGLLKMPPSGPFSEVPHSILMDGCLIKLTSSLCLDVGLIV